MASRGQRKPYRPSMFEAAFGIALLAGLPFALLVPKSFDVKFYALIAVFFAALAAGLGIALVLRRRQQPFEDRIPAPQDLVPELWSHVEAQAKIDTGKWSLVLLKRLEWRRFEDICAAYFEAIGFKSRTTRFGADGSIDLNLHAGGSEKPSVVVHCKAWNVYSVGLNRLRELRGAMGDAVPEGAFVTSGTFTEEAREFARNNRIRLIDGADLLDKINTTLTPQQSEALLKLATQGDFLTPTCPACGVKMTARARPEDARQFWGCVNYPQCRQTFFSGASAPTALHPPGGAP